MSTKTNPAMKSFFSRTAKFAVLAVLAVVACGLYLAGPQPAEAVSASDWRAGHIMDDAVFTNKDSMSSTQIQKWLDAKNSTCLKNYTAPLPLGDGKYGSKVRASRVIWEVGQIYNINPRVILVTLQKEQGLVTRGDCPQWRYDAAMGAGCPDTAACDEKYKGFSKQVYQGSKMLWNYFIDNPNWWVTYNVGDHYIGWHPNSGCGGTKVNILTRATAALYTYTPYQPNKASLEAFPGEGNGCSSYGNRNFWFHFNGWFGSPTPSRNIVLLRNSDNGAIYVIDKDRNVKIHIATIDAYKAWGFNEIGHNNVSSAVINSYDNGGSLRRLAYERGTGKAYFVDNKTAYHIPNPNMAKVWNLSLSDIPWLPRKVVQYLPNDRLAPLVKSPVGPEIYMMDGGMLRHYPSPTVLSAWEINGRATRISEEYFCKVGTTGSSCDFRWPTGEHLGFPKATSPETSKIFFINHGNKHWLSSAAMSSVYSGGLSTISQPSLNRFFNAPNATALLKETYDTKVYLLDTGKYRHVGSPAILKHWRPSSDGRITAVSSSFLSMLSQDSAVTSFTATNSDGIYYLRADKYLLEDSLKQPLIAAKEPLPVSITLMQLYADKGGLGTPFVTSPSTSKIFLFDAGGTKHHIGSLKELRLLRDGTDLPILELPHELVNNVPEGARVGYTFKSGALNYVFDDGGYRQIVAPEWKLVPGLELDSRTLSWFSAKEDLSDNFLLGSLYGIVRNGSIYLAGNQKLGQLWNSTASSPKIGSRLASYFDHSILSPLVKSTNANNSRIYLYDSQKLYHIPNPAALKTLNRGRFKGSVRLTDTQIGALETPGKATYILSSAGGAMDDGSRRRFADSDTGIAWGSDTLSVYHNTLVELLAQKTNSVTLTRRITSSDTSKHYCIENGQKRWITSSGALTGSSCDGLSLQGVNHNLLIQIPDGPNIH